MPKKLVNAIADMREEDALALVQDMVAGGTDPMQILEAAREAMDIVGKRFEEGQYFLPELIMAGEVLNQITDLVKEAIRRIELSLEDLQEVERQLERGQGRKSSGG